ncbi:hypothetical protein ACO0K7_02385 [Undibacterium sp. Ji67W]|uniref:hypothetical protein n=1 Tax=Undibacterium sp. Ji67W TaxID=3413042 RepID=UPI003BF08E89
MNEPGNASNSNAVVEAENALNTLASDIGAALSVATASLSTTSIYSEIAEINHQINAIANDAKRGILHLNRTIKISEEIAHFNGELISRKSINPLIPDNLISLLNLAVAHAEKALLLVRAALQAS